LTAQELTQVKVDVSPKREGKVGQTGTHLKVEGSAKLVDGVCEQAVTQNLFAV